MNHKLRSVWLSLPLRRIGRRKAANSSKTVWKGLFWGLASAKPAIVCGAVARASIIGVYHNSFLNTKTVFGISCVRRSRPTTSLTGLWRFGADRRKCRSRVKFRGSRRRCRHSPRHCERPIRNAIRITKSFIGFFIDGGSWTDVAAPNTKRNLVTSIWLRHSSSSSNSQT